MVQCCVQKVIPHSPSSLRTLPNGSRVPSIAQTRALIAENHTKTQPTTDANFTTIRRVYTSFNAQTDPCPPCRRISLAYIIDIPKDTSSSAGLSFKRTRNCNTSRTFDICRRMVFCQQDSCTSGSASIGYDTHRKFTVAE